MRRLRVVLLLVLVAVGLAPAMPAHAGGWAVTLLDPLPDRFEAGRAYTVGYWVLQHGSHPFEGELGKTGLRLVGPGGEREFIGQPLPEAAHYAVSFAVPDLLAKKPLYTRDYARKDFFYCSDESLVERYLEGLRRAGVPA